MRFWTLTSRLLAVSAVMLAGLAPALAAEPLTATGPLTAAQKAIFEGVPEDKAPEKLNATRADLEGRHYLTCDEIWLDKWYPRVKDLGGSYTGVGTDQAYTFIGWMKPKIAWMTDYDPWVKRMHTIYAVFFAEAQTIDDFLKLWAHKNRKGSIKLLMEKLPGTEKEKKRTVFVFKSWGDRVHRRLRRVKRWFTQRKVPSFVSDADTYTWVRQFILDGRARPVLCNLLDKGCFEGIGAASRELNLPLGVLYTSNAEGYWGYRSQFRANMQAQFVDDKSLLLRSLASKKRNGDYRYNSQTFKSFQAWLKEDYVKSVRSIVPWVRIKDEDDIPVTHIDGPPVDRRKKKRRRRKQ